MSFPKPNIAAVLETAKAQVTVKERPIPTPGSHELLVLNHAIAANPVEWRIQDFDFLVTKYPNVLGSDVCGTIVAIGDGVTRFKVGDRVTGFAAVIYNSDIDHGAWQTYTLLRDIGTTKIPDSMSFEEGSVFPMGFATAAMALLQNLGIPRPPGPLPADMKDTALLVWAASSSVGCSGIQIAKALGLPVYAVCSKKNHAYVKSLGATETFDYHDPDVVSKIVDIAKKNGVSITKAFDTISEHGSFQLVADVLVRGGKGGALATVLEWPATDPKPEGIDISMTYALRTGTDLPEFGAWLFNDWLADALEKKIVVPAPKIQIVGGGIGAAQKVYDMLRPGVSATKLVVKV
ncbi:GroES-like protein [Venustampulla echinocandica]|uniref:GroES-like protein n=1 Tax=Venustampulla echinocandica TaxID=2656787 RepID=A0A370TG20_9HELO|nr:GroES-like protein [Venustampulla echinocandica]RDL33848.1 GroES-like protein [Venustampulla echinocandica]